jgi:hypothetical protein
MKQVKAYRVKMGTGGQLPKGFPEGMLTGLTDTEVESLKKNPILGECFEAVELIPHPKPEEKKP